MRNFCKRIASLLLAMTVSASMMAGMTAGAFAAEGTAESKGVHVVVNGGEYDLGYLSDEWLEKNTGDAAVYPFGTKKNLGKVQYRLAKGVSFDKFFEKIGVDPEDLEGAVIHLGENGGMESKNPLPLAHIMKAKYVMKGSFDKEKNQDGRVYITDKNGEKITVTPVLATAFTTNFKTYDDAKAAIAKADREGFWTKMLSCYIGNTGDAYTGIESDDTISKPMTDCNGKYAINGYDTINIVYNDSCKDVKPVVTVKNTAKKTAKVTWKKIDGAKSYKLYRATKKSGKYTLVKKNITKTSFINKKLTKGKTYYYKVTAVNAFNKACKTSAVKSVKIKK